MKKLKSALLGLICCILLTGCTQASLSCGIDTENNAYLALSLKIDLKEIEESGGYNVREQLLYLIQYYESLGFEASHNLESGEAVAELSLSMTKKEYSRELAFKALKDMLTDEAISPFTTVSLDMEKSKYEEGYFAELEINGDKLLQAEQVMGLQSILKKWIDKSSAQLKISLPATELVESSGKTQSAPGTVTAISDISFKEPTALKLVTRASLNGERLVTGKEDSPQELLKTQAEKRSRIALGLGGVSAFFVLLFVFKLFRKKRKGY